MIINPKMRLAIMLQSLRIRDLKIIPVFIILIIILKLSIEKAIKHIIKAKSFIQEGFIDQWKFR